MKGASLDKQKIQAHVDQDSTSKDLASPHSYPYWAQIQTPPHNPLGAEGIDAFQNIEHPL